MKADKSKNRELKPEHIQRICQNVENLVNADNPGPHTLVRPPLKYITPQQLKKIWSVTSLSKKTPSPIVFPHHHLQLRKERQEKEKTIANKNSSAMERAYAKLELADTYLWTGDNLNLALKYYQKALQYYYNQLPFKLPKTSTERENKLNDNSIPNSYTRTLNLVCPFSTDLNAIITQYAWPDNIYLDLLYKISLCYCALDDYMAALPYCQRACNLAPSQSHYYLRRTLVYIFRNLNHPETGNEVARYNSDYASIQNCMAESDKLGLVDLSAGLQRLNSTLSQEPYEPYLLYGQGNLYSRLRQFNEAAESYQLALLVMITQYQFDEDVLAKTLIAFANLYRNEPRYHNYIRTLYDLAMAITINYSWLIPTQFKPGASLQVSEIVTPRLNS